jgi:hypothetical protein
VTWAFEHVVAPHGTPYLAAPQIPSKPLDLSDALQAWHIPLQFVSQHTPSTQ